VSILDLNEPIAMSFRLPKGTLVTIYRKLGGPFLRPASDFDGELLPEDFSEGPYLGLPDPRPTERRDPIVMEFVPAIKFFQMKSTATHVSECQVRYWVTGQRWFYGDVSDPIMMPQRDIQPFGKPPEGSVIHRVELSCEDTPNFGLWDSIDIDEQ